MFSQSHVLVCVHCSSHLPQPPGDTPPKAAQGATVPFLFTLVPTSTDCSADTPSSQGALLLPGVVPIHVQHFPHFSLWNCMRLLPAHCSSLPGSPWVAPGPSGVPTTPSSLVSSAKLLREQTVPKSRPLMSVLKRTEPSTDPQGTMMVSGLHLDFVPLISILFNAPH